MGSVKTNIGHTEGAAGACSVAKCALMLYYGQIPGSLHLKQLHPEIPLDEYGIFVPQQNMQWPPVKDGMLKRISANSFGIGGSNTHAIMEEFNRDESREYVHRNWQFPMMLPLSAHNEATLVAWAQAWIDFFSNNERQLVGNRDDLKIALHALIHGRSHLEKRICVLGDTVEEFRSRLEHVVHELQGEMCMCRDS